MNNIVKQAMLPNIIHFHNTMSNDNTEVMRITRDGVWVNPNMLIDDTAKTVLAALDSQIKVLMQAEREACAEFLESTNLAGLPEGTALHYARLLKGFADAIRARGHT